MKVTKRILVALACVSLVSAAAATEINVPAGSEVVLEGANNAEGNTLVLHAGSIAKIPSDGGDFVIKSNLRMVDGEAILSVGSGCSSVRVQSGLWADAEASLKVVGIGKIFVGRGDLTINYPLVDIATLVFDDAGAEGLVLDRLVTLRRAPTTCTVTVGSGTKIALWGTNTLAPLGYSGNFTLGDFDVVLLNSTAISSTSTVTVPSGRTIEVKPCDPNGGNPWGWAGTTPGNFVMPHVVLDGADAQVVFRNSGAVPYLSTPISGAGDVVWKSDAANLPSIVLAGPIDVTGCLRLPASTVITFKNAVSFTEVAFGGNTTVKVASTATVSFGDVVSGGTVSLVSSDAAGGSLDVGGSCPAGFRLTAAGGLNVTLGGGAPTSGLICRRADGCDYLWPDENGVIDCTGLQLGGGALAAELYSSGATLSNVPEDFVVEAKNGAAEILPSGAGSSVRAAEGSTVTLAAREATWKDKLMLWVDPSSTEPGLLGCATDPADGRWALLYTNGFPVVEKYADVRTMQTTYSLWNLRGYQSSYEASRYSFVPQVFPYAVTNGAAGLTYFSTGVYMGSGNRNYTYMKNGSSYVSTAGDVRRILLTKQTSATARSHSPTSVGAITMVFGSQLGGGAAIVGTKTGAFCRSGTTWNDPITTNSNHRVFVNGVQVDPTKTPLSGGWDVITVEMDGELFSALGWGGADKNNNDTSHCGGQNYGEVLVFAEVPSEAERIAAERYLAKKWGLASSYKGISPQGVELGGTGTVVARDSELEVSGRFAGTLRIADAKLTVPAVKFPKGEESLPTVGRIGWFDPDDAASLYLNRDTSYSDHETAPDLVWALYDRIHRAYGDFALFGVNVRRPKCVRGARGDGPVRNWIEYANCGNQGSVLRFVKLPLPELTTGSVSAQQFSSIREAFIVQDSSRGGGTPVVDKINGSSDATGMLIQPRHATKASDPIWKGGTAALVTGGTTRLNGQAVDGTKVGFTGRPELFSFSTTEGYKPVAFNDLWNGQSISKDAYGIQGEILLYDSVLSDADRKTVEDYLKWKWLGVMPAGCCDFRAATIAGSGEVTLASLSDAPKFDADFSGRIIVTGAADWSCTLDLSNEVVDAPFSAPAATLDLPASGNIRVALTGRRHGGAKSYVLVESAGFVRPVEWSLELPEDAKVNASLRVEDGRVLLDVAPTGFAIIFR